MFQQNEVAGDNNDQSMDVDSLYPASLLSYPSTEAADSSSMEMYASSQDKDALLCRLMDSIKES